jgi:hypothetical protein
VDVATTIVDVATTIVDVATTIVDVATTISANAHTGVKHRAFNIPLNPSFQK